MTFYGSQKYTLIPPTYFRESRPPQPSRIYAPGLAHAYQSADISEIVAFTTACHYGRRSQVDGADRSSKYGMEGTLKSMSPPQSSCLLSTFVHAVLWYNPITSEFDPTGVRHILSDWEVVRPRSLRIRRTFIFILRHSGLDPAWSLRWTDATARHARQR